MKKYLAIPVILALYAGAMAASWFIVPKNEPKHDVPDRVLVERRSEKGVGRHEVYREGSKYFMAFNSEKVNDQCELTRGEYLRCACIDPEYLERFESELSSGAGNETITVTYADGDEEEYHVMNRTNSAVDDPYWQMISTYQLKFKIDDDSSTLNLAIQDTYDLYGIDRGSYWNGADNNFAHFFYYGDCLDQIEADEDACDRDILDTLLAESAIMQLRVEEKIDKCNFSDLKTMQKIIEDESDKDFEDYIKEDLKANSPIYGNLFTIDTVPIMAIYFALSMEMKEPDKDMDCRLPLLDKKYEHITKYDKEGYVRTIIDGNTIVFLCFTPDDDGKLVLIAETDDEVSRDSFIEALEKVVLSDAPQAPTGEPVRKAHFLHRAIIITPIFIVVLIVTLVILSGIKPKKKEETEETIQINE